MSDPSQRFFLQVIDPQYACPVTEAMFIVSDLRDLRQLLGSDADDDPELRCTYWLEGGVLTALRERFGVELKSDGREVRLDRWHSIRAVPYLVHTNYELLLLLDGTKKFARMGGEYPPQQHENEELFACYVAKGVLHKEVEICPFHATITTMDGRSFEEIRHVYYVLKGDEWRIAAWKMLAIASQKTGWNETYERLEGVLFGYEEWQINWWAKQRHKRFELAGQSVQSSCFIHRPAGAQME